MKGKNLVILIGNLGQDPEVRYTQAGAAITTISIATTDSWTDKTSGQKEERVEWHRVVFFNRLAEIAGEYLRKGSQVYVEGALRTRKWQDQQGQDRYTTEIVAGEMQMLGGKKDGGDSYGDYPEAQAPQQQRQAPQARPQSSTPQAQRPANNDYAQASGGRAQRTPSQQNYQNQQQPNRSAPAPSGDSFDDD